MRHKRTAGGRKAARAFVHGSSRRRWKLPAWSIAVLLLAALLFFWKQIDAKLKPAAERACLYECRSMTSQVVSQGVANALETISVMELHPSAIAQDQSGQITGLHTDTNAVNQIQTVLLEAVNEALKQQSGAEYSIRIGTLTGMYTLADRGAEIPLRYAPRGTATVSLDSSFSSAGMNQTLHTLVAEITVDAGCSIPLYQADTTMTFTYLLSETVIVGDVPQVTWSGRLAANG